MSRAIKLYARTIFVWKSKDKESVRKEIKEVFDMNDFHEIQLVKTNFQITRRVNNPWDVEVSFYDWNTIQQLVDDKGGLK